MVDITVFTPTYNRADTLHRVRDSLLAQTLAFSRFEWLIVDDGSTDGTRELVETWMDGPITVRYTWQPNAGKHVAWNRAVSDARGELFVCMDSDDACVPGALDRFVSLWATEKRPELAGILVRCQTPTGVPIGPAFPKTDSADFIELVLIHGFQVEMWMALRSDVLRANPFPEVRVRYLPEITILHKISCHHRLLLHDECLRVYFAGNEGRADQITRISGMRYAKGLALMHKSLLDNSWRFLRQAPIKIGQSAFHFDRFSLHGGGSIERQIASLEQPPARALCWSLLPAAYALYLLDMYRGR